MIAWRVQAMCSLDSTPVRFICPSGRAAYSTWVMAAGPSANALVASGVCFALVNRVRSSLILHDLRALALRTVNEPRLSASSRNNSLRNRHVVTTSNILAQFMGGASKPCPRPSAYAALPTLHHTSLPASVEQSA